MGLIALECSLPKLLHAQMAVPGAGGLVALSGLNRDRKNEHDGSDYNNFFRFVKSNIEANVDDLAILHIVLFAFEAQCALFARLGHRTSCHQIIVGNDLRPDKSPRQV